jgi:hypothetical protein
MRLLQEVRVVPIRCGFWLFVGIVEQETKGICKIKISLVNFDKIKTCYLSSIQI